MMGKTEQARTTLGLQLPVQTELGAVARVSDEAAVCAHRAVYKQFQTACFNQPFVNVCLLSEPMQWRCLTAGVYILFIKMYLQYIVYVRVL